LWKDFSAIVEKKNIYLVAFLKNSFIFAPVLSKINNLWRGKKINCHS